MSRTVERPGDPNLDEGRGVEFALRVRSSPFPESWGPPEGRDPLGEQRAAWVRSHLNVPASYHRRLERRDAALVAVLRRAELDRREVG